MYVPRGYEVAEERPEIPPDELLALYEFNFIGNISKKLSKSRCSGYHTDRDKNRHTKESVNKRKCIPLSVVMDGANRQDKNTCKKDFDAIII